MPKSFLMSAKRKEEVLASMAEHDRPEEAEDISDEETPTKRPRHSQLNTGNDDKTSSFMTSPLFRPSAESAFSKIDRVDDDCRKGDSPTNLSPVSTSPPFSGFYPGFYPPMFTYPVIPPTTETGSVSSNTALLGSYIYPSLQMANTSNSSETSPASSPPVDKNMFYYVDPRIPFTNYFLNLTKLLKNSAGTKETSATTPLGKMAGDEKRASDTEQPYTPESLKSSPEKQQSPNTSFSPVSTKSCSEIGEIPKRSELKIDIHPERMSISNLLEHHAQTPVTGSLIHHTHPQTMMPLHGGGIFHPALLQLPGASTGFRRYNPEKPPPVKKYKCDVCGKAFSRSNTLVTHKRIHTGDKPFKCEICSRAFRQPGNLTRHRLTHTTVKPYVCPTCNKAFNRASNLHTHMRTHTSFKSYLCPYCGKGFHQKIDMKIHCYTHTAHTARLEAQ